MDLKRPDQHSPFRYALAFLFRTSETGKVYVESIATIAHMTPWRVKALCETLSQKRVIRLADKRRIVTKGSRYEEWEAQTKTKPAGNGRRYRLTRRVAQDLEDRAQTAARQCGITVELAHAKLQADYIGRCLEYRYNDVPQYVIPQAREFLENPQKPIPHDQLLLFLEWHHGV